MSAYTSTSWRQVRRRFLAKHPTCTDCGATATVPDHVPPRAVLVAAGIHNPDHERWLHPRCAPCHDRKTRTHDAQLIARLRDGADPATLAQEAIESS